jgi:protoporphyrinogen oxidase
MDKKIVILGAGPTGLSSGFRLKELGHSNFKIFEKENFVGGISASFQDKKGFTWDLGGHVIFSHYPYFDSLLKILLENEINEHLRESWIWAFQGFIPYPFQNNIKYLSKEQIWKCLEGLIDAQRENLSSNNFSEWISSSFGRGIAQYFMNPYNQKVWATPLELMNKNWISERVSVVDLKKVLGNVIFDKEDVDWGPNSKFKYPLKGGIGGFFQKFVPSISSQLYLNKEAVKIEYRKKEIEFSDGSKEGYDILISTLPINLLAKILHPDKEDLISLSEKLLYTSVFVIGIGVKKKINTTKCWVYFPEEEYPFYRITFLSNYSPYLVPNSNYSSILCETSFSKFKNLDKNSLVEKVIKGLLQANVLEKKDEGLIESIWSKEIKYGYPVPSLERDGILQKIQIFLKENDIYSRGRFGVWKYEIGNMDHSVMMGKEIVDRVLLNQKEEVWK